jgi:hypothetical protein
MVTENQTVKETSEKREERLEEERVARCAELEDECAKLKNKDKWVTDPQPLEKIETVESLAAHLYLAAQVELSTVPLYLYAAWSIRTKGYSQWSPGVGAFRTILGVAIEEMLHLSLVRNLIVAIGYGNKDIKLGDKPSDRRKIKFYDRDFVPTYPGYMLHHHPLLCLGLKRLSTDLIKCAFMPLEKPKPKPEEQVVYEVPSETYETLGQFYDAIKDGFEYLDKLDKEGKLEKRLWGESCPELQYYRGFWNQFGGGTTVQVVDLKTALDALKIVVEQGEGAEKPTVPLNPTDPRIGLEEWSHYEKFRRIAAGIEGIGIVDGALKNDISIDHPLATWPVISNPKIANYGKTEKYDRCHIQALMTLFNAAYCYVLCMLDEIYNTRAIYQDPLEDPSLPAYDDTNRRYGLERSFVAAMQGLLYPIADLLIRTPTGRTEDKVTYKYKEKDPDGKELKKEVVVDKPGHAGPSFEFYEFGEQGTANETKSKKKELLDLCEVAMKNFPTLGGADGVQRQISLLMEV